MQKPTITLAEICTIEKGKIGIQAAIPGQYPLVTTGEERGSHNEFHFEGEAVCIPMVSGTGHGHASIKRLHFQKGKFSVGSILAAVMPKDYKKTSAKFLYLYLSLLKDSILVPLMQGSANVSLKLKDLDNVEVPNISLGEQLKIVDLVDKLQVQQAELNNELEFQQTHLQLLRQAILQEAVQGKLSESEFRKFKNEQNKTARHINSKNSPNPENSDSDNEDAATLLKRIKAEKQKLIAAGKLKKEKELPPVTEEEISFELPKGWVWCRLGEVIHNSEAGKSLVCDKREAEFPEWGIIKVSAMSWGEFDEKENKALPANVKPTLQYKIKKGDYLISRANTEDLIGKSVIVREIKSNLLLSDKSIRIVFSDLVNVEYINFYNNSSVAREHYKIVASGTSDSMKNITREQMYLLPLPLPPLSEQHRIVAKVQQLLQMVNQLEQQVAHSQAQAGQLLQAVLKEAFSNKGKVYAENEMVTMAAEE